MVLLVEGDEAQSMPLEDDVSIEHRAVPVAHLFEPVGLQNDMGECGCGGHGEPFMPRTVGASCVAHDTIASCYDGDDHCLAHKPTWQIWSPAQSSALRLRVSRRESGWRIGPPDLSGHARTWFRNCEWLSPDADHTSFCAPVTAP